MNNTEHLLYCKSKLITTSRGDHKDRELEEFFQTPSCIMKSLWSKLNVEKTLLVDLHESIICKSYNIDEIHLNIVLKLWNNNKTNK